MTSLYDGGSAGRGRELIGEALETGTERETGDPGLDATSSIKGCLEDGEAEECSKHGLSRETLEAGVDTSAIDAVH
jgi:hypothetical protein